VVDMMRFAAASKKLWKYDRVIVIRNGESNSLKKKLFRIKGDSHPFR
jgi:hypothetical protein